MLLITEHFARTIKSFRGGVISTEMFSSLQVAAYGEQTPLESVAQVVIKNSSVVTLNPFDPANAQAIAQAVKDSTLNLNPIVENGVVICPIPKPSQETRVELSKVLGQMAEKSKRRIRGVRRNARGE